jgi:hypothetical protein
MKITLKRSKKSAVGTSLQGYVRVPYGTLTDKFGKPINPKDYKTDAEWRLQSPDGTMITIYNYRPDQQGTPKQTTVWHIGGHSPKAVAILKQALPKATFRGHERGGRLLVGGKLRRQKRGSILR